MDKPQISRAKYMARMEHLGEPKYNELERVNCVDEGLQGHRYCGWCHVHDKPRASCGCPAAWIEGKSDSYHDFRGLSRPNK